MKRRGRRGVRWGEGKREGEVGEGGRREKGGGNTERKIIHIHTV